MVCSVEEGLVSDFGVLQNTRILGAVGEGPYFKLGFMLTHFTVGDHGARFGVLRKKLVSV